ncbi:hypothetical protein V8Z80_08575 [Orrella sp. JC864]|uniref:hypothetical protein n=1 Tax=Orrella sp. JC864 TaxID=3120298 RepID=UPI00300AD9CA
MNGTENGAAALPPEDVLIPATFYDGTGRILQSGWFQERVIEGLAARLGLQYVLQPADVARDYVVAEAVVARPSNPARLEGLVLVDLPAPCRIDIDGQEYECDDTRAELEFSVPGTFRVMVRAWPYLDKEFTIENPA